MSNANLQKQDFNFFSHGLDLHRSTRQKTLIFVVFILVYLVIIVGAYFYLEQVINTGKEKIEEYNEFLQSEDTMAKMQVISDKKQEIENLKTYTESLDTFIKQLDSIDIIGTEYIQLITSAVPDNLLFDNVSMTSSTLQIQGNAPSRVTIAKFLNNMQELNIFQDIHVSVINTTDEAESTPDSNEDQTTEIQAATEETDVIEEPTAGEEANQEETNGSYTFTMSCELKGVIGE
jgi:Tfp pilus assembly protein PilN